MLANDAAVEATVEAYLAADPKPGSIFVDSSTVYPDLSEELAKKASEKGVHYLTAPIFGRPDAVLAHKGLHICAGDPGARAKVCPHPLCSGIESSADCYHLCFFKSVALLF